MTYEEVTKILEVSNKLDCGNTLHATNTLRFPDTTCRIISMRLSKGGNAIFDISWFSGSLDLETRRGGATTLELDSVFTAEEARLIKSSNDWVLV